MKNFLTLFGCAAVLFINGCCCDNEKQIVMEENAILLDVRTPVEFQQGHIRGAVNLPLDRIDADAAKVIPAKNTPVYLYCRSGRRSKSAREKLLQQGYTEITDSGSMSNAGKLLIRR